MLPQRCFRYDIRRKHKTSEKDSIKKSDLIVVLLYIQGTSEELKRILVRANIKTAYKHCTTLTQ